MCMQVCASACACVCLCACTCRVCMTACVCGLLGVRLRPYEWTRGTQVPLAPRTLCASLPHPTPLLRLRPPHDAMHHAMRCAPQVVMGSLATTLGLGALFLADQALEYSTAPFTITDSSYGTVRGAGRGVCYKVLLLGLAKTVGPYLRRVLKKRHHGLLLRHGAWGGACAQCSSLRN